MGYIRINNENGKWRRVTYVNDTVKEFLEQGSVKMTANRPFKVSISTVIKKHLNEAKLCEDLTGKTVWQVIKDNIELRKQLNELKNGKASLE